jgi:hypothetical protein
MFCDDGKVQISKRSLPLAFNGIVAFSCSFSRRPLFFYPFNALMNLHKKFYTAHVSGSIVIGQSLNRHDAQIYPVSLSGVQRTAYAGRGLVSSLKRLIQNQLVQGQLRHSSIQPAILFHQILQPPGRIALRNSLYHLDPMAVFPWTCISFTR